MSSRINHHEQIDDDFITIDIDYFINNFEEIENNGGYRIFRNKETKEEFIFINYINKNAEKDEDRYVKNFLKESSKKDKHISTNTASRAKYLSANTIEPSYIHTPQYNELSLPLKQQLQQPRQPHLPSQLQQRHLQQLQQLQQRPLSMTINSPANGIMPQRVSSAPGNINIQPQNVQQPQNVPEPQRVSSRQNVPEPQRVSSRQNVQQPQRVSSRQNVPEPQRVSSRQIVQQPQRVSSRQIFQQPQRVSSRQNVPEPQRVSSRQNVPEPQRVSSRQNVPEPQRVSSRQNVQQPQRVSSRQNVPEPQRVSSRQIVQQPQRVSSRQNIQQPQRVSSRQIEPRGSIYIDTLPDTEDNGQQLNPNNRMRLIQQGPEIPSKYRAHNPHPSIKSKKMKFDEKYSKLLIKNRRTFSRPLRVNQYVNPEYLDKFVPEETFSQNILNNVSAKKQLPSINLQGLSLSTNNRKFVERLQKDAYLKDINKINDVPTLSNFHYMPHVPHPVPPSVPPPLSVSVPPMTPLSQHINLPRLHSVPPINVARSAPSILQQPLNNPILPQQPLNNHILPQQPLNNHIRVARSAPSVLQQGPFVQLPIGPLPLYDHPINKEQVLNILKSPIDVHGLLMNDKINQGLQRMGIQDRVGINQQYNPQIRRVAAEIKEQCVISGGNIRNKTKRYFYKLLNNSKTIYVNYNDHLYVKLKNYLLSVKKLQDYIYSKNVSKD